MGNIGNSGGKDSMTGQEAQDTEGKAEHAGKC